MKPRTIWAKGMCLLKKKGNHIQLVCVYNPVPNIIVFIYLKIGDSQALVLLKHNEIKLLHYKKYY